MALPRTDLNALLLHEHRQVLENLFDLLDVTLNVLKLLLLLENARSIVRHLLLHLHGLLALALGALSAHKLKHTLYT